MSFIPEDGFMSIVEGMHLLKLMPLAAYCLYHILVKRKFHHAEIDTFNQPDKVLAEDINSR